MIRSRAWLVAGLLAASLTRAAAQEPSPVVSHLAEAVRIATVSVQQPGASDPAAFAAFLAFLERTYPAVFGALEVERINRHSVLMRWPGRDPALEPVLFDAHYDVVPIEPGTEDDWTHPPFSGAIVLSARKTRRNGPRMRSFVRTSP